MGLLRDIISAYKYKNKNYITSEEFIDSIESEFKRELDVESKFFFRNHDVSVNLLHKIFAGKLKKSGYEKDNLVIQALFMDMGEYSFNINFDVLKNSERPISVVLKQFSKIYPDAGYLISEGLGIFLKLEK